MAVLPSDFQEKKSKNDDPVYLNRRFLFLLIDFQRFLKIATRSETKRQKQEIIFIFHHNYIILKLLSNIEPQYCNIKYQYYYFILSNLQKSKKLLNKKLQKFKTVLY